MRWRFRKVGCMSSEESQRMRTLEANDSGPHTDNELMLRALLRGLKKIRSALVAAIFLMALGAGSVTYFARAKDVEKVRNVAESNRFNIARDEATLEVIRSGMERLVEDHRADDKMRMWQMQQLLELSKSQKVRVLPMPELPSHVKGMQP